MALFFASIVSFLLAASAPAAGAEDLFLPDPPEEGSVSVERALFARRSTRSFEDAPLSPQEIGRLLWSAQGRNRPGDRRTAPSAGATYPLVVDLAVGEVEGWEPGIYRYDPSSHALRRRAGGDRRGDLADAAYGQRWVGEGAAVIILSARYARTTRRYGERGIRYVHVEAGAAAENVHLQAAALGLGTVLVGAFDDAGTAAILDLEAEETPLLLLPIGRPSAGGEE